MRNHLENSNRLHEVVFHELAHASHFSRVGPGFWDNYISYIINVYIQTRQPYGDGTARDFGLVAISEAWGFHIGWYLTQKKYGANARVAVNASEWFIPLLRGNLAEGIQGFEDDFGIITGFWGWIPAGILQDLMDNAPDMVRFGFIDNAGTFTNQEFFNSLDYDVRSPQAFRDRLMYRTSNRDRDDVKRLFEAYNFN